MTVPRKVDPVPSVAELPTCQNTLQDWAPLIRLTKLPDAVVSAEPAWKTNTASGSPAPFSVRAPVSPIDEAEFVDAGGQRPPAEVSSDGVRRALAGCVP